MSKLDAVYTEERDNCTIRIVRDEAADSPNEWGNEDVFLVAAHRQFTVRRKGWDCDGETFHAYTAPDEARPKRWDEAYRDVYAAERSSHMVGFGLALYHADNDLRERQAEWDARKERSERYYLSPLGAYIHSGVALYAGGVASDWDSGNIGYIVVDRQAFKAADGTLPDDKRCEEIAKSLVSEWNTYLEGRVFGFIVEHTISGEEESCWGFYCEDWDGRDYCLPEAREVAARLNSAHLAALAEERAAGNDPLVAPSSDDVQSLA